MTKIDVISGFLGAGKTTLIQKLLKEAWQGEQVVLIENEFGEIGIDGGFLKEAGIEITEMNSGCICCSLVGDFGTALKDVMAKFTPDRIVIEPSGVGKLSDVVRAIEAADLGDGVELNSAIVVVDATKAKLYVKNFGEFFINQVEHAGTIILSRTQKITDEKLKTAVDLLREHNKEATIITTPWEQITGQSIKETMEGADDLLEELLKEVTEKHHHHDEECDDPDCECHHHHDHDHDGEECGCHHHHDHDEEEHEHHHHHDHDEDEHEHHHHHDDDEDEHEHHHHHDHDGEECDDPDCECHHHHHGHHHADEVFTSWGLETPAKYTKDEIEGFLGKLTDAVTYGMVLRAKGMVPAEDGSWIYFDYVPGESNVRTGAPQPTGKFCVIGSKLNEEELEELFKK
ncbi:MAG: GTP-binding protein [Lachnospiraceae bacterium]|nr:GTP-binding protein [Lachnospiraceae bacterium]